MTPTVYLAGPILGCTEGQAKDWRKVAAEHLAAHNIRALSPLRCEPIVGPIYAATYSADRRFGTAPAIFAKNLFDTKRCDFVLAYLPKPADGRHQSYGTIAELAWARALDKPLILVTDDPKVATHPVLSQCAGWVLDTMDDALDVLVGVLGGYAIGGKAV